MTSLVAARHDALSGLVADWTPERHAELADLRPCTWAPPAPCAWHSSTTSLEELGQTHAGPPLSKDVVAGRIRRLLQLADRTALAGEPGRSRQTPTSGIPGHAGPRVWRTASRWGRVDALCGMPDRMRSAG